MKRASSLGHQQIEKNCYDVKSSVNVAPTTKKDRRRVCKKSKLIVKK